MKQTRTAIVRDCGINVLILDIPNEAKQEDIIKAAYAGRKWHAKLAHDTKKSAINIPVTEFIHENPETINHLDDVYYKFKAIDPQNPKLIHFGLINIAETYDRLMKQYTQYA